MESRPTVTLDDRAGMPVKIEVCVRESETMPSRLKVHFRTEEEHLQVTDFDGNDHAVAIPGGEGALCAEFRLEMN